MISGKLRYCLLAAALAFATIYVAKPGYLELNIAVPKHPGGGEFWWEDQYSELAYADSGGVLYVHRQVGTGYSWHGWKTVEDVFQFFDQELRKRGWSAVKHAGNDPALPESRLLSEANLRRYYRPDQSDRERRVLLAVWPRESGDSFNVVLTVVNASFMKLMSQGLD